MYDIILMKKVNGIHNLFHNILDISIGQIINLFNPIKKFASFTMFQYHIIILAILINFKQSDQIGVV